MLRQFKSLKEEYIELQKRFGQLQEQMTILDKKLLQSNPSIVISPTFSNIASFSNQIIYQIQYNDELLKKELDNIKRKYQTLEPTNKLSSDPQKLKKTVLFLGAKQIFATTRQDTINSLIETYESSDKSGQKYDKIALVGDYISNVEEIANIVPGGGIAVKVLSKGIPAIANLLKSRSLTTHSQEFGNYLIEDEKSLLLLQQTYQSLVDSQDNRGKISPVLTNLLKFNQDQFNQHDIFEVSKLKKEEELTSEKMQKAIELLTNHFQEFTRELRQETNQYAEKMEVLFAGTDGELLQVELTKLLEKLAGKAEENAPDIPKHTDLQKQIIAKQTCLKELTDLAKDKLKSNSMLTSAKQERMEKLESFFKNLFSNTEEFIKELESIKHGLSKKLTEKEIKDFCQINGELRQLQKELESLQGQQSQMEVLSKSNN